ncbi:MAG: YitT family protein [Lachnospiraceae bacterium]|nr:YitT family protein [Lachnospiraceae bacterium]
MDQVKMKKIVIKLIALTASAILMAVDTKTFINTGGLYPGGVGGLTLLLIRGLKKYCGITLAYAPVNLLLNAGPIYVGFKYIGKKYTAYSCFTIVLASVFTDIIPSYVLTYDILLISIFGGLLGGFATVLCLWVDATAGGTDFISVALSVRKGIDAWNIMFGFNCILLAIAGMMFGWDKALYSIIFQYAFTQLINMLYQRYQKQTLFIVTQKTKEVSDAIYQTSFHGATILWGEGSYEHGQMNVIYSIISRGERGRVISAILKADPDAFINSIRTEQLRGGRFYQKPTE